MNNHDGRILIAMLLKVAPAENPIEFVGGLPMKQKPPKAQPPRHDQSHDQNNSANPV